ncbi:MAG: hypothetical protein V4697_04025 [Patescibacteria group bacterium]
MQKFYVQHPGKVIEATGSLKHIMAITLDPTSNYKEGVVRCITSREGEVDVRGYVDRSELRLIHGDSLEHFTVGEVLKIKNQDEIIKKIGADGSDFIGLEDPDIVIDEKTGLTHLYFTMPFMKFDPVAGKKRTTVHLGHAVGKDLHSLEMTMPVLMDGAKEVSIAPLNSQGFRYNLIESWRKVRDRVYSVVQTVVAEDLTGPWEYGDVAFHPAEHSLPWVAEHISTGPLLPKSFIDIGEGKLLGIINGREASTMVGEKQKYGIFSVGVCIYNFETGKIEWVSPEPLIRDSEATNITFASHFVETEPGKGVLYAHVDDSFVRAYTLEADILKSLLPR